MNKPDSLRYVAYVRKSEERQERQELSHQSQLNKIRESFPELNIVKWMDAESKSAFKPGRVIFNEMLAMVERGEVDGIIAWHPNRLSRNEIDSAAITYMLRTRLKDLKFCSYNFDNSAEGIMMLQMVMNQSQYESSKQGRDVKRGMEQKAINGERPGQVPLGYVKAPLLDESGGLIKKKDKIVTVTQPDPLRYDLVKRMWSLLLSGQNNASQIRKIANDEWHFTTRKTRKLGGVPLATSMIYKMFNNPFYAGYIAHNGEMYIGTHNAMITLTEYDYAQTLLGQKGKPRSGVNPYAYTGLMHCGVCGCSIVGKTNTKFIKSTNKMKTYVHYYCTRKSDRRPCNQSKYTSVEKLEREIDQELAKYTILPEFRDLALKIIRAKSKDEVKDRTSIYKSLQQRRNDLQAQLDRLLDLLTRGVIDEEAYTSQRNQLMCKRDRIDAQMRGTEDRGDEWMELTEKVFDFATYARIRFNESKDLAVKREILATLGTNFTLKDGKLSVTPNAWLVPLEKDYPALEIRYLKGRTIKKTAPTDVETAFEYIFETWRARRDLNPRHPA